MEKKGQIRSTNKKYKYIRKITDWEQIKKRMRADKEQNRSRNREIKRKLRAEKVQNNKWLKAEK